VWLRVLSTGLVEAGADGEQSVDFSFEEHKLYFFVNVIPRFLTMAVCGRWHFDDT
jgi:hypothetical protein